MDSDKPKQGLNYAMRITGYYLFVYPSQPGSPPVVAVLTLMGVPDTQTAPNTPPGIVFYINFHPDSAAGVGPPVVDPNPLRVMMDMFYYQLEGLLDQMNDALLNNGPACYVGYQDSPVHAYFSVSAALRQRCPVPPLPSEPPRRDPFS